MVAQAGQDVLAQIDMNGSQEFKTIAGIRATKISLNAQTINATHLGSAGRWRELVENAGVRSATINGSGVFVDDETDARIQSLFFEGQFPMMRMRIPDFGDLIGRFQIVSIDFSGNYDGEASYEFSFASSGEISFVSHVSE